MAGKAKKRKADRHTERLAEAKKIFDRLAEATKEKAAEMALFKKAVEIGATQNMSPIEVAMTLRTERRLALAAQRKAERKGRSK